MRLPDAALGSIIAAAIAGLVVFISTVLAKEQKTSEFRQVWIDEIRKDISNYMAGTVEVVAWIHQISSNKIAKEKFIEENFQVLHELQSLENRIILRLNDKDDRALIDAISSYRKNMISAYDGANRQADEEALTSDLLALTKSLLKNEWSRVKRGEPTFQFVKWGGLVIVLLLGVFALNIWKTVVAQTTDDQKSEGAIGDLNRTQIIIQENRQLDEKSKVTNLHPSYRKKSHPSDKVNPGVQCIPCNAK